MAAIWAIAPDEPAHPLIAVSDPTPIRGALDEIRRVIDVLTLNEGRISKVDMVADELGLLTGLGAVTLA